MCPICYYDNTLDECNVCSNCGFKAGHDYLVSTEELQELYELDNEYFWNLLE